MASLIKARVKETTTTTGTGTLSLDGAVSGFRTFLSAFGNGNSCYYTIIDGTAWEMGMGVVSSGSPSTLTRAVILDSSASGAALTLGAGTKSVFCEIPAEASGDRDSRILRPVLPPAGTFLLISGTAYYVYLGKTMRPLTVAFVEFYMTTVGTGAQTAEVGLFSTPLAPNKAGQTLTKIAATGTVDSLTATLTAKRNTASFAQAIAAGVHLWAGIRSAMASNQPTCLGMTTDCLQGNILTTTGQGALTGLTTTAGGIVAINTATVCPALFATLD
jgi:hypothetical protein